MSKSLYSCLLIAALRLLQVAETASASLIEIEFSGQSQAAGTPFAGYPSVPMFSSISGRFIYDPDSAATHTVPGCTDCVGYRQQIPDGLSVDYGALEILASDYVVEVRNNVPQASGPPRDFFAIRYSNTLAPAPTAPLLVNGDPFVAANFTILLAAGAGLFSDTLLPTSVQRSDFMSFPFTQSNLMNRVFTSILTIEQFEIDEPVATSESKLTLPSCIGLFALFAYIASTVHGSNHFLRRGRAHRAAAFTLVELLAVVAIIGILLLTLLPALQAARESARRSTCLNHVRQVSLSLVGVESATRSYPVGARSNETFGLAWWVDTLPFLEEEQLYKRIDRTSPNNGWVAFHADNAQAVRGVNIEVMVCPSTPLPRMHKIIGLDVLMPSYVGISGATNEDGFPETRVAACCQPVTNGQVSAGGVLFANGRIRLRNVADGISKTIAIGETSDWATDAAGRNQRIDGGFPNGWITGTRATGCPPKYDGGLMRPPWNITTIRYPPNMRDYMQPGIDDNRGANNPLVSAHPGGVHVALLCGTAQFVSNDVDVVVLKRLATRDDGGSVEY